MRPLMVRYSGSPSSKRAREERALAAERRLQALQSRTFKVTLGKYKF